MGYSGIRIYSGIYSGIYSSYSAPRSRIARMEIQVYRNANSSQTNAYSHYYNYFYSGLIPNERALEKNSMEYICTNVMTIMPCFESGTFSKSTSTNTYTQHEGNLLALQKFRIQPLNNPKFCLVFLIYCQ